MNVISPASNSATNTTSVPSVPSVPRAPDVPSTLNAPISQQQDLAAESSSSNAEATMSAEVLSKVSDQKKFLSNLGNRSVDDAAQGLLLGYASQQVTQISNVMKEGVAQLDKEGKPKVKRVKSVIQVPVYVPTEFGEQANVVMTDFAAGSLLHMLTKAGKHKSYGVNVEAKPGSAINLLDVMSSFFDVADFDSLAEVLSSQWIRGKMRQSDQLKMALSACGLSEETSSEVREFIANILPPMLDKYLASKRPDGGKPLGKLEASRTSKALVFLRHFESTGTMKGAKPQLDVFVELQKHLNRLLVQHVKTLQLTEAALDNNQYADDAKRLNDVNKAEILPIRIKALEHIICASNKLLAALRKFHMDQMLKDAKKNSGASSKNADTTDADDFMMLEI